MLKGRNEFEKYLESQIIKIIANNEICKGICEYSYNTYDIPKSLTSDYLTMRIHLSQASEFILFCLNDSIEKVTNSNKTVVDKYFTMQEVKTYRLSKFEVDKIKFPLKFKVIQINDDQWIGKIDVKNMLMKLREAQLINYNVNAQRTMQRIVKGEKEYYKITINNSAVNAMKELFKTNTYIPTAFTLNIPLETNSDFYYDEKNSELVITSLDQFDISDGYHRYVTCCALSDEDPNFNYTMELRIVNFTDDKARQFIYQEDQKTKMKKIDSDSYNVNKAANIVTTRLNENPQCNLQGLISRNQGLINFGDLSELINYFYFKNTKKEKEKSIIISTVKELTDEFNLITEYDSVYLEREYSYKQLCAIMCMFNYYKDQDKSKICNIIDKVIEKVERLDNKKFYSKTPKKSMMNDIEEIIKEVE